MASTSGPHIVVIGLGITGSAALCRLALRGVRATGIEQFEPGHDRGSSHGATRMIRLAHFENAAYVPLLRRAYELWREIEAKAGRRLVVTTGIAEIGSPDSALVRNTLAASTRYNLAHEVLDAGAFMRRHDAFRLPPDFVAVLQPDGGYIEAAAAIEAQLRIAADAGAVLHTQEKVIAIEPRSNGVRIRTDRGAIDADGAIIAAGPWMAHLLPDLHLPLRVTRQVVGWFVPSDPAPFAAGRFPAFIIDSKYGGHYGLPAYGARGVKVAKHYHFDQTVTPDSYERSVSAEDEAAIRVAIAEFLPGANGPLHAAETCLYTMTPDGTFIIDRTPGHEHIVVASPCCGHGFKFAPVVGEILADLATTGETAHDIGQFRLQRFG